MCRPDGQFGDSVSPDVFLEAGLARFTISESWGWFNLDAIVIESDAATRSSHYRGIPSRLINPNANAKTQRVMNYITSNFGKKVISGQYCGHNKSNEVDALFRETGKYPALRGFDFIFYSPNAPLRHDAETDLAIEWSNKAGQVDSGGFG